MRILILNYEFPPLGGGAATASAQIARHLARKGVQVTVLTSHYRGLAHQEERDGYGIVRVSTLRSRLDRCTVLEMGAYVVTSALPALRLARRLRPDALLVFFGVPTGPVGLLVNLLMRTPYLLSLRGGDVPGFLGGELVRLHRLASPLTRLVWARAGALVANSDGLRELATRTAPDRAIHVVPNGVDTDHFHPSTGGEPRGTKTRILFIGRLARQKGVSYLLQAMARLDPERLKGMEVELVGSGSEEDQLRALAREMQIESFVRFAGWVPRADILTHYQSADLFVLPSLDEGMPNAMLEAMACGLPVLATDIRGNRELVLQGVNGLLVPPADPEALAQGLQQLIASPKLREEMGRASRVTALKYDWAAVADQYQALAEQLLTSRARRDVGATGGQELA